MSGDAIPATGGWGRQRPRSDPVRDSRNRQIVERFAAGETYTHLGRAFAMTVDGIRLIVHRYLYRADPDLYWQRLRAHGHRAHLPQGEIRAQLQTLLARDATTTAC